MANNEISESNSEEIKRAIRKEAIEQTAKWTVAGAVGLVLFALGGWWLYLKPMLPGMVGGVPPSAVVAFHSLDLDEDTCPPGWSPFLLARARTLVGAGDPSEAPLKLAYDERGKALQGYVLGQHGGEQEHQLIPDELPSYNPIITTADGKDFNLSESDVVPCLDSGCNQVGALTNGYRKENHRKVKASIEGVGRNVPHNNMPPYVAVYYCKKNG